MGIRINATMKDPQFSVIIQKLPASTEDESSFRNFNVDLTCLHKLNRFKLWLKVERWINGGNVSWLVISLK